MPDQPAQPVEPADFADFLRRRAAASDAFVDGDFGPLGALCARRAPATLFGPGGDCVQGPDNVDAANRQGAAHFAPGSGNRFEVMHSAADGDLGYWVGVQRATVRMQGKDEPVPMALRLTEIYRRDDAWKLIHRHADRLQDAGT